MKTNTTLLEEQEQALFVQWLELKSLVFSAIPHSTFTKSWKVKARNKAMGVRPGVPDMMVIAGSKLVFIELKRLKGGVISKYQKQWIKDLHECNDVIAGICYGYEDAKQFIQNILDTGDKPLMPKIKKYENIITNR